MAVDQIQDDYWQGAQKFQFTVDGGVPYTVRRNPRLYEPQPMTAFEVQLTANIGPNIFNGAVEYGPKIMLEWDEMDWTEFQQLAQMSMQPITMIDMLDQGYYGMLILGPPQHIVGAATKTVKLAATMYASRPADGINSLVNIIYNPVSVTTATLTGGAISAGVTTYYWLTYFSPLGETRPLGFSINTGATANAYNTITWTAPPTGFYRKARLYAATTISEPLPYVMGEVLAGQTQQWTDYTGCNGIDRRTTLPAISRAYTGQFQGGIWINLI